MPWSASTSNSRTPAAWSWAPKLPLGEFGFHVLQGPCPLHPLPRFNPLWSATLQPRWRSFGSINVPRSFQPEGLQHYCSLWGLWFSFCSLSCQLLLLIRLLFRKGSSDLWMWQIPPLLFFFNSENVIVICNYTFISLVYESHLCYRGNTSWERGHLIYASLYIVYAYIVIYIPGSVAEHKSNNIKRVPLMGVSMICWMIEPEIFHFCGRISSFPVWLGVSVVHILRAERLSFLQGWAHWLVLPVPLGLSLWVGGTDGPNENIPLKTLWAGKELC